MNFASPQLQCLHAIFMRDRVGYFIPLNDPLNGHPPSYYYAAMTPGFIQAIPIFRIQYNITTAISAFPLLQWCYLHQSEAVSKCEPVEEPVRHSTLVSPQVYPDDGRCPASDNCPGEGSVAESTAT